MLVHVMVWAAAAACLVGAAPTSEAGGPDQLPAEHRQGRPLPLVHMVDAVLKSKTMSAMDEAAARATSAFGDIIEDLGDFMVATVKDLPDTIRQVSDRVGEAVSDGSERVVIVVKGVRAGVKDLTEQASPAALGTTVDKVFQAANTSQTATSLQKLQDSLALSVARIFGSLMLGLKDMDTAVADGIKRVSEAGHQGTTSPPRISSTPPSTINEIQYLA